MEYSDKVQDVENIQVVRGYQLLEDREFESARKCFNAVLNINPRDCNAHWGILLGHFGCKNNSELIRKKASIEKVSAFHRALEYSSGEELQQYQEIWGDIQSL